MCGITGIFSYAKRDPVCPDELARASEVMVPRGPDDHGSWLHEKGMVGFAHRRLSIIDLSSSGHQPMVTKDKKYCIVFNGEIYNFLDLKNKLLRKGHTFLSSSDTEVLLRAYIEYGERCVDLLRGMFAFAVWDDACGRLFLARDHFGMKPLYYSDDGSTFRFSSQVKSLCAMNTIGLEPDPAGHCGFFIWGTVPDPHTLFRKIKAVPAGESISIDLGGGKKNRSYFVLSELLAQSLEGSAAVQQPASEILLGQSLRDTVASHLFADVPVAIFLSSGLDSSIITAIATESQKSPISTLTLGFKEFRGTANDETVLAKEVALHYATNHRTIEVPSSDFHEEFEHIITAMDQPSIDGVNSYFICKAARDAGIKVTISGLGGDELFGGYPSFQQIPLMASVMRRIHVPMPLAKGFRVLTYPVCKRAQQYKYPGIFEYGGDYARLYLLRRSLFMPWEIRRQFDSAFFKQGCEEIFDDLDQINNRVETIQSTFLKIAFLELHCYMKNQLLRDSDWASMAHSVELRLPFVDVELLKTVVKLHNVNNPVRKRDLARIPEKALPMSILNKRKTGFTIPVEKWINHNKPGRKKLKTMNYRQWAHNVYHAYLRSLGVNSIPSYY